MIVQVLLYFQRLLNSKLLGFIRSFKQCNVFQGVSGNFKEFQGVSKIVNQSLRYFGVLGRYEILKQVLRRFKELMYRIIVL